MVAQFDKDQEYVDKLNERRRRDLAVERQQELQRSFLLEQMDELASDFADHPEQIGHYIADLEAAGMLSVADRGMLFRRLWETMGPAFADQAFRMTERAVFDDTALASDIARDAKAGDDAPAAIAPEAREDLDRASQALLGLANALGLNLDLKPAPEATNDDRIVDPDAERAAKTRELLDVLGPQLGVDARDLDVKVDAEAYKETQLQGLYGLMHDGTVFLNPDVYDPETSEGRGLLAHEVSHVAQRENMLRGAYDADPSIATAEHEADEISEIFGAGGAVQAPLASLGMYDQAACGPREMQETPEDPQPEPHTEVVVEPPVYDIVEDQIIVPNINFPFDEPGRAMQGKASIDASGYKEPNNAALRGLIETVAAYPEITGIRIESHTDQRGSNDYNMRLSERRARATEDWLKAPTDGGAPLKVKMNSQGYGETRPKIPGKPPSGSNLTEAQHRENRRSEFHIIEVNGKPHTGPFKPTKRVIVQPGRVITRYYDKDGKLVKEEIQVDGQPTQTTTPGQPAPGSAGGGGGGG
ncbi:MAG: DUF4157 domain-containing protein, partial [Myxococcales bacterium]|nr:DUF4157 domain-containing protein [Myxococcales bacterium]